MKIKRTYKYEGPVFRFEHCAIGKFTAYTSAYSKVQAINQIKARAKRQLKLSMDSKVDIDNDKVTML